MSKKNIYSIALAGIVVLTTTVIVKAVMELKQKEAGSAKEAAIILEQPEQVEQSEVLDQTADNISKDSSESSSGESKEAETAVDTSDWKTYRNEEYGFEFEYPRRKLWIRDSEENTQSNFFTMSFFPAEENIHTSGALNLGGLIYCNDTVPEYMHITNYRHLGQYERDILGSNLEWHISLNANELTWFCYIPAETKLENGETVINCVTEEPIGYFYQISFFVKESESYLSNHEILELINSFRIIK